MRKESKTRQRKPYQKPEIKKIEIDKQISMVMMSPITNSESARPMRDPWSN